MIHPSWRSRPIILAVATFITAACSSVPSRQALTLTLSPSNVTAPADGQVQFTATATYNMPPSPVTPAAATWGVIDGAGQHTTAVSIDNNGLAQCSSEASGVYTVGAWILQFSTPPDSVCNVATPFGNPCGDSILTTTQLTCP
ncbi:MAG: hypothetical protein WAL56_11385 [Candidatus Sulfotelmatobacter sp.]